MITQSIFYIVFLILGYFIGRGERPDLEKIAYRARKLGTVITGKVKNSDVKVGIVYRPDAERLDVIKNHSADDEGMSELLAKIPGLKPKGRQDEQ